MSVKRQQHYVPRRYIKGFSDGGCVWWCNIMTREHDHTGTKGVGFVNYYYECWGIPENEAENKLEKMETEGWNRIQDILANGSFTEEDKSCLMRYISMMHIRSPVYRCSCREVFDSQRRVRGIANRDGLFTAVRRHQVMALEFVSYGMFGIPYSQLDCIIVRWEGDVLMGSDNPVFPYDLDRIAVESTGESLDGFIFPIDMKNLLIVFRRSDSERAYRLFSKPGGVDKIAVNEAIIGNAIAYVYYKNWSQIAYFCSREIERPQYCDDTYYYLKSDLEESEGYWTRRSVG